MAGRSAPSRWSKLRGDLKVRVVKFLSCPERARVSLVSKSMQKACNDATMIFPHITNGQLPEKVANAFFFTVNAMRYGVYALGLAENLTKQAVKVMKTEGTVYEMFDMNLLSDLMALNSKIFPFWEADFSGKPGSGVFSFAQRRVKESPFTVADAPRIVKFAQQWPQNKIKSTMYLLLERPDGTVAVSEDLKSVYLVQGIWKSLGKLMSLPAHVYTTCLPFYDYIAFDGLIAGTSQAISNATRRQLFRAYAAAVDTGTLITRVPLPADAAPSGAPRPAASPAAPAAVPPPTAAQRTVQQQIKALPKSADLGDAWMMRVDDRPPVCSEGEHVTSIISCSRRPVVVKFYSCPPRSSLGAEMFELLGDALLNGVLPAQVVGACPAIVLTDQLSALPELQALLGPAGIEARYYCPPTEEGYFQDQHSSNSGGGAEMKALGCDNCHVTEGMLRAQGKAKMKACYRCRAAYYCSRECQKAHWKVHKKKCNFA